ncbi:MAG TPA: MBL fold metallo-hydrolase [Acidobacteriota bacterium]|jgi:glyoxylase-like metal-dependent hydrolase (beta-lactamase superfamily II)|nr:MBL fold metallo-hydrolase [Acidobacteriota bacterium]
MFFRQIKQSGDNFSYVIADEATRECAVVDPNFNTDAIIRLVKDQNLLVKYVIDTHGHFDHTAGNEEIKSTFGAKVVAHKLADIDKDINVDDGDTLRLGKITIRVIYTPGHTRDGICLLADGKLLTGDTLFVGECGRTDLPGSSSKDMYDSLFNKLMKLDDSIEVYPGHDYGSRPYSTIGLEKKTNYVLEKRTLEEFIEFMRS